MYYHIFKALKTNNAVNFNELKNLLNKHFKDFDKAQMLLQQADFVDLQNNLASRAYLARIYYETKAFDSLESLLVI